MNPREYTAFIIDTLNDFGPLTTRAMFGGIGLYKDALIFGFVVGETLYFKVDNSNRSDYEAYDSSPFTYHLKDKIGTMSYWNVPTDVIEDPDQLTEWAQKAYAVSIQSKLTPKKR